MAIGWVTWEADELNIHDYSKSPVLKEDFFPSLGMSFPRKDFKNSNLKALPG